ncbi:MAG: hypothetical protein AB7K24_08715 [Gemmataceae bacterium]
MKNIACVLLLMPTLAWAVPILPDVKPERTGPVRVLVPALGMGEEGAIERLKTLGFEVTVVSWQKLEPDKLKDIDVIFLPTHWGEDASEHFKFFEKNKEQFHRFVKRGGGLVASQPNPSQQGMVTPGLLPYPITFKNWYDDKQPAREHLAPDHFITKGLAEDDLPFPADPMVKVDEHYTLLARQKSTQMPSLAVCNYGAGRIVVQTAAEGKAASIPIPDEIIRRIVVWSAQRDQSR